MFYEHFGHIKLLFTKVSMWFIMIIIFPHTVEELQVQIEAIIGTMPKHVSAFVLHL